MNGKNIALASVLLVFISMQIGAAALTGQVRIDVSLSVSPTIKVEAPEDLTTWEINPDVPGTSIKAGKIHVKSNTPWYVSVEDADPLTAGYMTEWTGEDYAGKKLSHPLKVKASNEVDLTNGNEVPLAVGGPTGSKGEDVPVTIEQVSDVEDEHLDGGHAYRMVIVFTGHPLD